MGYSDAELVSLPDGADLGLGCGNPQAFAVMRPGEVVVDLGSGAGIDCFLAAQQVGPSGRPADQRPVPSPRRALTGLSTVRAARLPGYLVPRLVREVPGAPAKVALVSTF